jgi:hypothetical protein
MEVKSYTLNQALEDNVEGIIVRGASIVSISKRLPLIYASSHYPTATQP